MIKVSKRDLILDSIIQAYLSDNAPIGSSELCSRMDVSLKSYQMKVQLRNFTLVVDEFQLYQL